jgi:DNA polymerase III subunit gamma/tau
MFEAVEALPVKYRPRTFEEFVGNVASIRTLRGMFKRRQKVGTYLLEGPTGCGKTTLARIISMVLNCQNLDSNANPCLKCKSCTRALIPTFPHDCIHEYNVGGEAGKVDNVRKIVELSKALPRFSNRCFILDEAQGITSRSMSELFKIVEEPPKHVVWILCTMEPDKLHKAMPNRCKRLWLSYPKTSDMVERLKTIIRKEYDKRIYTMVGPYLTAIVDSCGGQPRSSITVLSNVADAIYGSNGNLTKDNVKLLVREHLSFSGEVDTQVIKFLSHLLLGKKLVPLTISGVIEDPKVGGFINMIHRYCHYAALYMLYRKKNRKPSREEKYKFGGVSFIRWENNLDQMMGKGLTVPRVLKMCAAATEATKLTRGGNIAANQIIIYLMERFLNS